MVRIDPLARRALLLRVVSILLLYLSLSGCRRPAIPVVGATRRIPVRSAMVRKVVDGAMAQTQTTRFYDASYVRIPYPNGDVPLDRGVCADVIVRAFRSGGVDLQQEVHEDMASHFAAYPQRWALQRPDPNIDHRRVPNLMTFFTRRGKSLPVSDRPEDYQPGDVVVWRVWSGALHTGLVIDQASLVTGHPLIVHNMGAGAQREDVLFTWPIIGHYRCF